MKTGMARDPFDDLNRAVFGAGKRGKGVSAIPGFDLPNSAGRKRKTLTNGQRIIIWDNPKIYGRTCSICGQKITKMGDLQLDHTRAHSKGGNSLALAHAVCNRVKGTKSLKRIQKELGVKHTPAKKVKVSPKKKAKSKTRRDSFDFFKPF